MGKHIWAEGADGWISSFADLCFTLLGIYLESTFREHIQLPSINSNSFALCMDLY